MNQADEANFRYPVEGKKKPGSAFGDQERSESAKIETLSGEKPNEINPFELFPPAFHEFLEIPIHAYANGTTYNPHDKHKASLQRPFISGGYASTNVNGQKAPKEENEVKNENKPKRRRRPINRSSLKHSPESSTEPIRKSHASPHERLSYAELQKEAEGERPQRLPPVSQENPHKRRPGRPSLRIRTRAPPTTENEETTTQVREILRITPEPPVIHTPVFTEKNNYEVPKRPLSPLRTRLNQFPVLKTPVVPFTSENAGSKTVSDTREKEYFNKPRPSNDFEKGENINSVSIFAEGIKEENKDDYLFRQLTSSPFEREKSEKKNTIDGIRTLFENESTSKTGSFEFSNSELYRPKEVYKVTSKPSSYNQVTKLPSNQVTSKPSSVVKNPQKHEFKPSQLDPFAGGLPSNPPFLSKNPDSKQPIYNEPKPSTYRPHQLGIKHKDIPFPQPTTFRPHTVSYDNLYEVLPPVKNTYKHPEQEIDIYYANYPHTKFQNPFSNIHSVRPPFSSSSRYRHPNGRQDIFIQPAFPVYTPTTFFRAPQAGQESFQKYDPHFSLNAGPLTRIPGQFSDNRKISHENGPPRRRVQRPRNGNGRTSGKIPSFFSKFNIFKPKQVNRRSGISGTNADVNVIKDNQDKYHLESDVDYVLSNGPAPFNGKKVLVIGPFRDPPIGAPRIYPGSQSSTFDVSQGATEPSLGLKPPSSYQNLPKTSSFIKSFQETNNESKYLKNQGIKSHPEVETQSKTRKHFYKVVNETSFADNRPPMVSHNNYHLFEEVSDADKERLIAAKFEFPRESSVKRSGIENNVIPIPVPLISPSGDQISDFHRFQVSHLPITKKQGKPSGSKHFRRLETVYIPHQVTLPKTGQKAVVPKETQTQVSDSTFAKVPMRITPYSTSSALATSGPSPQSYQEPSVSKINFGGWQLLGESPVFEYVREVTPAVTLKKMNEEKTKPKPVEENAEDTASVNTPASPPEKELVLVTSELNVEAPENIKSYAINSPRKL